MEFSGDLTIKLLSSLNDPSPDCKIISLSLTSPALTIPAVKKIIKIKINNLIIFIM